jgi:hypothetical protein
MRDTEIISTEPSKKMDKLLFNPEYFLRIQSVPQRTNKNKNVLVSSPQWPVNFTVHFMQTASVV